MKDDNNKLTGDLFHSSVSTVALSLIEGLRRSEKDAWSRLAHLYGPLVYHWCVDVGLQKADADDVLQEVFRTVLARISDFRDDRPEDNFLGWLRVITRNKIGDWIRRQQKGEQPQGGSQALDQLKQIPEVTEDTPSSVEEENLILEQVLELVQAEHEPRTWQAFWRTVVDDRRPDLVAEELGMSRNAVYVARSRVLRRLRELLGSDK